MSQNIGAAQSQSLVSQHIKNGTTHLPRHVIPEQR